MNQNDIPDFSRQLKVPGMSLAAQEKLARARVLVFGAGGLAASAVPWLAASGIGHLTIVDGDTVSASNLHRQLPFTYADIGKPKAEMLADYCRARMAEGTCEAVARELGGAEILQYLQTHDVALDCTDSRALAYQLNDAALLCAKPVVFANASALAGQLFVLHPGEDQPCWRCLWPEDVLPGGNCDALGVMGPVPGVMGMLQALEALKVLAGFAAPLQGEVLQYDFARLAQSRFAVPRAPDCNHRPRMDDDSVFAEDWQAARAQGLRVIDIRSAEETAARPCAFADDEVPMDALLATPAAYLGGEPVLLVCASGQRAQSAARLLHAQGFAQVRAYPRRW